MAPGSVERVVVRARPGRDAALAERTLGAGATDLELLPLVDGFAAAVPAGLRAALESDADVMAVIADEPMSVQSGGETGIATSDYLGAVRAGEAHAQGLSGEDIPVGFLTGNWNAGTWYLSPAYVNPWQPVRWHGSNWHGSNWHGQPEWSSFYGTPWNGAAWYGAWG